MSALPSGTVTFLFTDLEGSSRLWEEFPDAMKDALARHDVIVRDAVAAHGGCVVKTTGDGAHAAFATAQEAVNAAVEAQLGMQRESWGETGPLRIRMGLHTGAAELRDSDYYGTEVNRAARLMAVAHGGQVVCSQTTADLARGVLGAGLGLVDLGDQQLRDLQTPERVFQITHPELPTEFPALRTLDAFAGNLPLQVTEFVGRDEELVELGKLLSRSRLVTLTGSGGVGKTRLALQAAADALPHYGDGAWFVDLAPIDDDAFVATEVATTMGLPEHRQGSRDEALVAALMRRQALVVLDNCEHLVEAVARVVDLVVRRCPGVTVLATSQEGLGVEGEATFVVRPLREDDAERLFVDRAEAARHDFQLTSDTAETVLELCRRLDGIPLAIELAAARVASMSPAAILERIDERFRLLGQGRRTARRRHQTLRAAVDWSYGLLSEQEQFVFERLSIFAGDFTLEATEAIVADDDINTLDVLDLVSGLVTKSMVQLEARPSRDWYRMLETMRDYGLERLAQRGDLDRLREVHAAYYLDFVEEAAPHFVGRDDAAWCARVDEEYPNIRAALLFTQTSDPAAFVRMVHALAWFWSIMWRFREGLAWITAARTAGPDTTGRAAAEALAIAGVMALNLTRWQDAFTLIQASLDRSAADAEPPRAKAISTLGLAAHLQNRPEDTRRHSEEAVALARARGEPFELAETLAMCATNIALAHDETRGIELADESLELARTVGNDWLVALALQTTGVTRWRTDPARAITIIQASLDAPAALGPARAASARYMKAFAHLGLREDQTAAVELRVALPSLQEVGEEYYVTICIGAAAVLLRRHGQPHHAARILAVNERLREEGRIFGSPRDLHSQQQLKERLEREIDADVFTGLWAEGRTMTLDEAVSLVLEQLAPIAEPTPDGVRADRIIDTAQ
jgi:predicted ATPase/class 3 adenylate cyclase